jgi:hypothetical protein
MNWDTDDTWSANQPENPMESTISYVHPTVTRTKVVSPEIDRFRGKPYFLGPFGYNITSISIDLML